jgi:magnesium-transporting ATPase (P-type)
LKSLLDFKDKLTEENTLCTIPFTRESKRGSIIVRNPELTGTNHEVRVYCKGAPDFFLEQMEDTDEMTYPELTSVQTGDGVYELEDSGDVPDVL